MRAVPLKRDLPVTLMLRWCFNNFLHTEQGERGGEGCSTHTHTAMDTPRCPSNTVWIQIVTKQNVLCEHSEGSEQQSIVALKHQKSQWSTCLGQAFVIICLFFESHLNLEEILIVVCQEYLLTLSEDLFYLCTLQGHVQLTLLFFFPGFWLAF